MAIIIIRDQPYEANPLNYVSCKLQPDRSNISCAQPMQAIVAGSELLTPTTVGEEEIPIAHPRWGMTLQWCMDENGSVLKKRRRRKKIRYFYVRTKN